MRRLRIMILAIILATLGAILPMSGAIYFLWLRAVELEEKKLAEYLDRMISRALISVNEAESTLMKLSDYPASRVCSENHIEEMRRLTLTGLAIEQIGYFDGGVLKCSTWGNATQVIKEFPVDFTIRSKINVTLHAKSRLDPDKDLVGLMYGHYVVYLDSHRFLNIIIPKDVQIAITHESGVIMATLHDPSTELIKNIISSRRKDIFRDIFITQRHQNEFYFVAIEPVSNFYESFKREQLVILPFGMLTALFIVCMVFYYSRQRLSLLGELKDALKEDHLLLYYQPIIDAKQNKYLGAEALIRWRRNNGDILTPDTFIPFADENGLSTQITEKVIHLAIRDLKEMLVANREMHVSINLTGDDLKREGIFEMINQKLANADIFRDQFWLEISETALLKSDTIKQKISSAREQGYKILIDDFGTGYSNLSYLQQVQMDYLKIDKIFVDSINTESASSTVIDHIIKMGGELKLGLIAEGVEKQDQLDYLLQHGVAYIQGYFYSKPLPLKDFLRFTEDFIEKSKVKCSPQ